MNGPRTMNDENDTWREDDGFQEFGGEALLSPRTSGFSMIGAGGTYREEDGEAHPDVVLYLEELDSGRHIHASFDPEAARSLAASLLEWADDADAGERNVEDVIEEERAAWRARGGIAGS